MALSKDLLEILVCPLCKANLDLKPDNSGLKCVQCHRVYPIRDDIPVMLVDESETVSDKEHARLVDKAAAEGIEANFDPGESAGAGATT